MEELLLIVHKEDNSKRIDKFLGDELKEFSRSFMKKLIENGEVLVNGNKTKSSYKVKEEDIIKVFIKKEKEIKVKAENLPLDIIYENKNYLILNKKQGMVIHPGEDNIRGTLVNGLLNLNIPLSDIEGKSRPGIVHRLDKETTGLLVVCKTNNMHINIKDQLLKRTMDREYLALVYGVVKADTGKIDAPIGRNKKDRMKKAVIRDGREAISNFKVIKRFKNHTFLKISLDTGRTHQIRVHMGHISHPIVGDNIYGIKNDKVKNLMLHAHKIGFDDLNGNRLYYSKPVNQKFRNILKTID